MSLHALANNMAARGRGPDSTLVHMSPREVHGLQALAMANGGTLTINPQTGLPEAGFLDSLLPMLAGFALNAFLPGVGGAIGTALGFGVEAAGAVGSGLLVGGATGLATGSLEKGLMAGLGAYGGAGLAGSLGAAGSAALDSSGFIQAPGEAGRSAIANSVSPAGTLDRLQAGVGSAMSAPTDFLKSNYMNLGLAAAPALSGAFEDQTSSAPKIHPGYIRKYDRDPVTGTLYQVSATPADQYTGGINFGGVPEIQGVPPVKGYAQGGVSRNYLSSDEYGREFGDPNFGQPSERYEGITIQGGNDEYGNLNGSDAARRAMLNPPVSLAPPNRDNYGPITTLPVYPDDPLYPDKPPVAEEERDETSIRFGGVGQLEPLKFSPADLALSDSQRVQNYLMGKGPNPFTVYHKEQKIAPIKKKKKVEEEKVIAVEPRPTGGGDGGGRGGGGFNSDGGGSAAGKAARDGGGFGGTGSGVGGDGGGNGPGGSMGGPNGGGFGPTGGNAPGPSGAKGGYLDHGRFIQHYDEGGTTKKVNFGGVGQLEPVNTSDALLSDSERTQNYLMGNGPNPFTFYHSNEKKVVPETKAIDNPVQTQIDTVIGGGPATLVDDNDVGISRLVDRSGDVSSIVNKSDTGGEDFGVTNQPPGAVFNINDFDAVNEFGIGSQPVGTTFDINDFNSDNGFSETGGQFGITGQPEGATFNINDFDNNTSAGVGDYGGKDFGVTGQPEGATFDINDFDNNTSAGTVNNSNGATFDIKDFDNNTSAGVGDYGGKDFGVTNQPEGATFNINDLYNNNSGSTVNDGETNFYTGGAEEGMDNVYTGNPEFAQEYVDPRTDPFEEARRLEQSEMNEGYFGSGFDSGSDSGGNFGSGFDSGGGCPAPWINITLADGSTIKAGDIKPGMMVYTRHETTNEWGNFPVTVVRKGEDTRWAILFESGIEFVGTFNHPVMVNGAWVEIQHLKDGDKVVQPEGFAVVKSAKYFDHGPIVKIEVQDAHTYLTEGFLSHNKNMADYDFGGGYGDYGIGGGGDYDMSYRAKGGPIKSNFKNARNINAYRSGLTNYAGGGIAALAGGGMYNLGSYSDGGRLLRGPGDGVSDSIPATIGRNQPARLADGEFVVPARIVSELGNGSTEAGARKLYAMMDRVQKSRAKTTGKNKIAANSRADKYLPA